MDAISTATWSALSFFLGLLLGHRLAIGRDKRKEFNDSTVPVRSWLLRQIANPHRDLWPEPFLWEMDAFLQRLNHRDRDRFKRLWFEMLAEFEKCTTRDPGTGAASFRRSERTLELLHKLEPMTRPK